MLLRKRGSRVPNTTTFRRRASPTIAANPNHPGGRSELDGQARVGARGRSTCQGKQTRHCSLMRMLPLVAMLCQVARGRAARGGERARFAVPTYQNQGVVIP